jgi:hypothetical protein
VPSILITAFASLFLTFLLLLHGHNVLRKFVYLMRSFGAKKAFVVATRQTQSELSRYLLTVSVINVCLGLVTAGVLWFLGMPDPLLWAGVIALLNFAPYLGPSIVCLLLLVAGFADQNSFPHALLAPSVFLLLHGLEGQLITPHLVGRQLALDPVVIFLGLLTFGWLWGITGLLMAVPILACVKVMAQYAPAARPGRACWCTRPHGAAALDRRASATTREQVADGECDAERRERALAHEALGLLQRALRLVGEVGRALAHGLARLLRRFRDALAALAGSFLGPLGAFLRELAHAGAQLLDALAHLARAGAEIGLRASHERVGRRVLGIHGLHAAVEPGLGLAQGALARPAVGLLQGDQQGLGVAPDRLGLVVAELGEAGTEAGSLVLPALPQQFGVHGSSPEQSCSEYAAPAGAARPPAPPARGRTERPFSLVPAQSPAPAKAGAGALAGIPQRFPIHSAPLRASRFELPLGTNSRADPDPGPPHLKYCSSPLGFDAQARTIRRFAAGSGSNQLAARFFGNAPGNAEPSAGWWNLRI